MSGINDHGSFTYGHGIISQNCFAKEYSDAGFSVKLVFTGTFVQVHSVQDDDVLFCIVRDDMQVEMKRLICKRADIINVPENLWGPLFTVKKMARLPLVKDSKVAESIANISVGHIVQVLGPDSSVICIAIVTFRNSIGILGVGIYFGLQVLSSKESLQTVINKVSLLGPGTKGFPRGCDLVVTVDKIRPSSCTSKDKLNHNYDQEYQKQLVKNFSSDDGNIGNIKSMISYNLKDNHSADCKRTQQQTSSPDTENSSNQFSLKSMINLDTPLNVGDEVLYLDGHTPEKGVIRWMEIIENSLKVGVEFDNPIGTGTKNEGLDELFRAKCQHTLILPPVALIKLSDSQINASKETLHLKKFNKKNINNKLKTNYIHNSSNNNNNNNNNNNSNNNNNNNSNNSNNNYNNNINNNGDYCRLNEFCCDWKQNIEMYKKSKRFSVLHQCLKHPEKIFEPKSCNRTASKGEIFDGLDIFAGEHKLEGMFELEGQQSSKNFDFDKPCEKKTNHRRNCTSVDNSSVQMESDLNVNTQDAKFSSPCWNCSNRDLSDLRELKQERSRHNHYSTGKKVQTFFDGEDDDLIDHKSIVTHPDEILVTINEKDKWDSQNLGHSNSEENLANVCDISKPNMNTFIAEDLGKGSVVELTIKGEPHYGVIRWIGTLSDGKEDCSTRLIAGIEMEEECPGFTDGTFNNKRYFQCNPKKAFFVPLNKCRKDSRFSEESQKQTLAFKVNYGQIDCPVVEGTIPPIFRKDSVESICGKNRGIQGHHNSCYLDATLFSMFAFTSVFDSLLYRPPTKNDIPEYSEVQRVLREEIVNPLRKNFYVRADRVMKLRTLLEKLSSVSGLTSEEKDPEEFLNSLLAQILKAEPFLKLSSGQEAFHYQLFVEKDERLILPSVQQLFEQSFVTSDIKLKQVPSCLIIQMPRFGKSFKMYSRILPPQLLDITDIIENSPRQCTVCGKLAEYECKDCFGQQGIGNGLESISFCKTCLDTAHNHHCRSRHNSRALTVPVEFYELQEHCIIPRLYMELFAVVCIETSHYVAFVKCGSGSDAPWCFFDSMADRKGEQNGYNIPEMVLCPDLAYWLSEDGAKMLNEMREERQLPEHAKRLFSDAYMCMYQSPDLMMYR